MRLIVISLLLFLIAGCSKEDEFSQDLDQSYFPSIQFPVGNEFSPERYALGKRLFFDTRLSENNDVSCGSCHDPSSYFADDLPTSSGTSNAPGTRNSPSLVNVALHPFLTREGSVPTLEMQVLVPVQEHNEFNSNIVLIAEALDQDQELHDMSVLAYGEPITPYTITRSIANYERMIISQNSKWDKVQRGEQSFTSSELRGKELFFSSELNCGSCHIGFDFTSFEILNNGLYSSYEDPGLARFTGNEADSGKFKVPGLRNVAETAPYMHDGSLVTLEEVVLHYSEGGKHALQDERIRAFELDQNEMADLIAFLNALTDYEMSMPQ